MFKIVFERLILSKIFDPWLRPRLFVDYKIETLQSIQKKICLFLCIFIFQLNLNLKFHML